MLRINLLPYLKNKIFAFISIFLILFFLPLILSIILSNNKFIGLLVYIIFFSLNLFILNILFKFLYEVFSGHPYILQKKIPFKNFHIEPHHHLTFIYKKYKEVSRRNYLPYPLRKEGLYVDKLTSNNLGFFNGLKGNRDIEIPKPKNTIRVNCLGASTTANVLSFNNKNFSYPILLEQQIHNKLSRNIEVNNCGVGGYTSSDILISYALNIIETKPDFIIIYCGYNDINAYLTDGFSSDYSHSRRNLGETYFLYFLGSKIPYLGISIINYLFNLILPNNISDTLSRQIKKGESNINNDPTLGLQIFKRNIKSIIHLCKNNGTKVIISTFCFYLHDKIKNDELHIKYQGIVDKENSIIRAIAKEEEILLVDNEKLIPKDDKFFVDSIHFSIKGMEFLSKNFFNSIKKSGMI